MNRNPAQEAGARLTALRRYMRALERGDLDDIATIVHLAESDAALERMLLTINEAYLEQREIAPSDHARLAPAGQSRTSETTEPSRVGRLKGTGAVSQSRAPRPHWGGVAVAALVLVAVLGGFFALFSARGAFGPSGASGPSALSHGCPPSVAQAKQPAATQGSATIIVGNGHGLVAALRLGTGSVVWNWCGRGPVNSVARSADIVYIASHPTSNDGGASLLTALRATDGARLWQTTEPQLAGYTYMALDGAMLLVASGYGDGTIYALDARTGKLHWSLPGVGGLTQRLITSMRGVTYVSSLDGGGGFNAYDTRSGKLLWSYDDGEAVAPQGNNGPLIVAGSGGQTYYYHSDLFSRLAPNLPMVVALDSATGAIQERLTLSEIGRPYLVTADGVVYTTLDNQLCAFQIAGGDRLWRAASIDGMDGSLRLVPTSAGLLYSRIVNDHVEVGALDNATGKQIWAWHGSASLYSAVNSMSLAGDNDMLYLATSHGMYAFRASTGKMVWHALATTDLSFVQPVLAG